MKIFTLLLLSIIGITYNYAQKNIGKKIILTGIVSSAKGKTIAINSFQNNKMVPLDSATLDKKGKFKLNFKISDPKEFYSLSLSKENYALLILDSTSTESKLFFKADSTIITKDYTISGSEESKDILEFTTIVNQFQEELNELKKDYSHPDSAQVAQLKQQILYKSFTEKRNSFVDNHLNSLALLITTSYFNPQAELDWFKKIEKALSVSVPNSKYHMAITSQIQQIEAASKPQTQPQGIQQDINIGKEFTELNFTDPNGKAITMESLKGNYVLVDFWASWCKPCRMENPNVVNLYNKYKDKGFSVYSVSLDTDKNRWLNAIEQDNLTWPNHVSDLKGWKTEATQIYQFRGIPYTMLVDPNGKIIATKLRGQQLDRQMEAIFGF